MSDQESSATTPPPPEATPAPEKPKTPEADVPPKNSSRRFLLLLILFLLVSQSLLVLASAEPYWWAALPVLSLTGVVGWRSRWIFAPLLGFAVGFGFWGVELALLPAIPRARLANVLAGGLGVSPTVVYLIGPLLLGVLAAFGAMTVAGGLRLFDDLRAGPTDGPGSSSSDGTSTTAAGASPEA